MSYNTIHKIAILFIPCVSPSRFPSLTLSLSVSDCLSVSLSLSRPQSLIPSNQSLCNAVDALVIVDLFSGFPVRLLSVRCIYHSFFSLTLSLPLLAKENLKDKRVEGVVTHAVKFPHRTSMQTFFQINTVPLEWCVCDPGDQGSDWSDWSTAKCTSEQMRWGNNKELTDDGAMQSRKDGKGY